MAFTREEAQEALRRTEPRTMALLAIRTMTPEQAQVVLECLVARHPQEAFAIVNDVLHGAVTV